MQQHKRLNPNLNLNTRAQIYWEISKSFHDPDKLSTLTVETAIQMINGIQSNGQQTTKLYRRAEALMADIITNNIDRRAQ